VSWPPQTESAAAPAMETEGDGFIEGGWCNRCKHDQTYREGCQNGSPTLLKWCDPA
jgi:hypothetical protein